MVVSPTRRLYELEAPTVKFTRVAPPPMIKPRLASAQSRWPCTPSGRRIAAEKWVMRGR
jgi:hypothetical protein